MKSTPKELERKKNYYYEHREEVLARVHEHYIKHRKQKLAYAKSYRILFHKKG